MYLKSVSQVYIITIFHSKSFRFRGGSRGFTKYFLFQKVNDVFNYIQINNNFIMIITVPWQLSQEEHCLGMAKIAGSNPAQGFSINIPSMIATKFFGYQHVELSCIFIIQFFLILLAIQYNEIGLLVNILHLVRE